MSLNSYSKYNSGPDTDSRSRIRSHCLGFTLIELMVVVVIIAILATVVVPSVMNRPEQARISAARSNIKVLESAVKMYKLDNLNYPTTDQGLQALVVKPGGKPAPVNWNRYLDRLPSDPWGRDFLYLTPGKHGEIDIFSPGPNGVIGDADDIGSWEL